MPAWCRFAYEQDVRELNKTLSVLYTLVDKLQQLVPALAAPSESVASGTAALSSSTSTASTQAQATLQPARAVQVMGKTLRVFKGLVTRFTEKLALDQAQQHEATVQLRHELQSLQASTALHTHSQQHRQDELQRLRDDLDKERAARRQTEADRDALLQRVRQHEALLDAPKELQKHHQEPSPPQPHGSQPQQTLLDDEDDGSVVSESETAQLAQLREDCAQLGRERDALRVRSERLTEDTDRMRRQLVCPCGRSRDVTPDALTLFVW